jgi:hypothetical protein
MSVMLSFNDIEAGGIKCRLAIPGTRFFEVSPRLQIDVVASSLEPNTYHAPHLVGQAYNTPMEFDHAVLEIPQHFDSAWSTTHDVYTLRKFFWARTVLLLSFELRPLTSLL